MTNRESSILDKAYDPVLQAVSLLLVVLIIMLITKMMTSMGWVETLPEFPWSIAATFLLFFAIANSISSISAKDLNKYWGRSMMSFAGLAIGSGFLAYFFSSVSIGDARTYKWIFIVLTIGYMVFLSIIGFMKRIVEFAEKEDWQAPKKK